MKLPSNSIEWALKHITRFYASDFFPDPFEFEAIENQWPKVREYLENIDLEKYTPKAPTQTLAPKPNGTFRVVHELDPIDALVYTALAHALAEDIEAARIPAKDGIACSYRIGIDVSGSFFAGMPDGWDIFTERTKTLIERFPDGVVLVCDIIDFFNQIYSHRLRNVVGELNIQNAELWGEVVERFIESVNTKTSRGIPVGPAASIIFSEALLIDIDRKILSTTRDFVRWVDDFRIFFKNHAEAQSFLHEFTSYLHDNHRLVLSGEKTKIITVKDYAQIHEENDSEREGRILNAKSHAMVLQEHYHELVTGEGPYGLWEGEFDEERFEVLLEEFRNENSFKIASEAYRDLLIEETAKPDPDYTLIRRILRNAKSYRIRSILPAVLDGFPKLLPVTREVCLYLKSILNSEAATRNADKLLQLLDVDAARLPYVNMWLAWLFAAPAFTGERFARIIGKFTQIRDQAGIAITSRDLAWVKSRKNGLDTLGPYEKRAIMNASRVLTADERKVWLGIARERGDFLEQIVASFLISYTPKKNVPDKKSTASKVALKNPTARKPAAKKAAPRRKKGPTKRD